MDELYIFDLDGTLADCSHRLHLLPKDRHGADGGRRSEMYREFYAACINDRPIHPIILILSSLRAQEYGRVQIWTGRSEEVRGQTHHWMRMNGVGWFDDADLKMRPVGDHRPDTVLKAEWYHALPESEKLLLAAVFEDRDRMVKMWRDLGVTCLQVADGKF